MLACKWPLHIFFYFYLVISFFALKILNLQMLHTNKLNFPPLCLASSPKWDYYHIFVFGKQHKYSIDALVGWGCCRGRGGRDTENKAHAPCTKPLICCTAALHLHSGNLQPWSRLHSSHRFASRSTDGGVRREGGGGGWGETGGANQLIANTHPRSFRANQIRISREMFTARSR